MIVPNSWQVAVTILDSGGNLVMFHKLDNTQLASIGVSGALSSQDAQVARAGAVSNLPCSRIHRRRARATSARSCSAARNVFFERDLVTPKEPPYRGATGYTDPGSSHPRPS